MSSNLKQRFEDLINKIFKLSEDYDDSILKVQDLILRKGEIININNNQDKDDIKFYNSIFDDAIFYIQKSLKIRKKKFNYDFIKFYQYIDENASEQLNIHLINKEIFIKKFNKYVDQQNQNSYKWLKNDKKKLLYEWVLSFEENVVYHIYLFNTLLNILHLNIKFFTEKPEEAIEEEDIYDEISKIMKSNDENSTENTIDSDELPISEDIENSNNKDFQNN